LSPNQALIHLFRNVSLILVLIREISEESSQKEMTKWFVVIFLLSEQNTVRIFKNPNLQNGVCLYISDIQCIPSRTSYIIGKASFS
jgi:hypothetical protein